MERWSNQPGASPDKNESCLGGSRYATGQQIASDLPPKVHQRQPSVRLLTSRQAQQINQLQ